MDTVFSQPRRVELPGQVAMRAADYLSGIDARSRAPMYLMARKQFFLENTTVEAQRQGLLSVLEFTQQVSNREDLARM